MISHEVIGGIPIEIIKKKNLKNSVDLNQNDGGSLELIKNLYRFTLITLTVDLKFVCVLYHL